MKVIRGADVRPVATGGCHSHRFLVEADGMGYTVTKTVVLPGLGPQAWHYPQHLESCYCVSGHGRIVANGEAADILPDTLYAPEHDEHTFEVIGDEPCVLICVFLPALRGDESHDAGGYGVGWRSPTYEVRAVPIEQVVANDYNPNKVAPPEMELLETSIWEDGYTQPVVTVYDAVNKQYVVVDGFHRYLTLKNSARIRDRERGLLPVVVLNKEVGDRMASTIRHNRARGTHNIELMSQIVAELVEMGKSDGWICRHIGMSLDELLRMKQITGLASLFANADFSEAWEAEEDEASLSPLV